MDPRGDPIITPSICLKNSSLYENIALAATFISLIKVIVGMFGLSSSNR